MGIKSRVEVHAFNKETMAALRARLQNFISNEDLMGNGKPIRRILLLEALVNDQCYEEGSYEFEDAISSAKEAGLYQHFSNDSQVAQAFSAFDVIALTLLEYIPQPLYLKILAAAYQAAEKGIALRKMLPNHIGANCFNPQSDDE